MKHLFLAAGAAALALSAGAAVAAKHHHSTKSTNAGAYAEPAQPIAYAKLDDYLKASPGQRKSQDWSLASAGAATGAPANASATIGSSPEPQAGAQYQAPASAPDNSGAMSAPSGSAAPPPDQSAPPAQPDQSAAPANPPATGGDTSPKP